MKPLVRALKEAMPSRDAKRAAFRDFLDGKITAAELEQREKAADAEPKRTPRAAKKTSGSATTKRAAETTPSRRETSKRAGRLPEGGFVRQALRAGNQTAGEPAPIGTPNVGKSARERNDQRVRSMFRKTDAETLAGTVESLRRTYKSATGREPSPDDTEYAKAVAKLVHAWMEG